MKTEASFTAIVAARMRAGHLLFDGEPKIFRDDLALRFSGSDGERSLHEETNRMLAEAGAKVGDDVAERLFRSVRAIMIMRSRYTEDALSSAIAQGVTCYVILGAGLDSFAWRRPDLASAVQVFEIDHPASQGWKQQRLQELGIHQPVNLKFLPIDFENQTLLGGLRNGGYPFDKPAFLSWLGVTQYLTREAALSTLKQVAALASGTEISFTFVIPQAQLAADDQRVFAMSAAAAAARSEPWISFFEPAELTSLLQELGFARIEHFSPADANVRYFAERSDGLCVPAHEHVMLARVK